ncbi:hypothetical protein HYH03_008140 [Edaphochlamys debaryana]|uniref:Uncharacterized protein n=1 Tax=Edaphochlamys debaryana TaxID=47281 RepID=A0A835Y0F3_9CHLO|nr:hypothetical protein HYH03_008140 [Edaphochlamys debaryana]|eukprot:KAG2493623.1 hypothetical protein HYH03_008140 [Edaphochlamys debaryana]
MAKRAASPDEPEDWSFEWNIPNFMKLADTQVSDTFEAGGYRWRILGYPKQNREPHTHVSVFLELVDGARIAEADLPTVAFKLLVCNRDPAKHATWSAGPPPTIKGPAFGWGISTLVPRADLTKAKGFLQGGALRLRVEISDIWSRPSKRVKTSAPSSSVCADLLALLDDPGPTSDVTLIAGERRFEAHRAILAARCPYFRTLFASGFRDGGAREVALPDAQPDALSLLLRFMYGGELGACGWDVLRPAVDLADRLLLPAAKEALQQRIVDTTTADTILADAAWAERMGHAALAAALVDAYPALAKAVPASAVLELAGSNPQLLAQLLVAVTGTAK